MNVIECSQCSREIMPFQPCLRVREVLQGESRECTFHYHLMTCCIGFRSRADELLDCINKSAYPTKEQELIVKRLEGTVYGKLAVDNGDSNDENTVPPGWKPFPKTYISPSKKTESQGSTDEMLDRTKSDNDASAEEELSDNEMESAGVMETSSE